MSDLHSLELLLRRIRDRRQAEFDAGTRTSLDLDTQELLLELADGLAATRPPSNKARICTACNRPVDRCPLPIRCKA